MKAYEFKCVPPVGPFRIVRIEAASLEEAVQRAGNLWVTSPPLPAPRLLAVIDLEPQQALAFL